MSNLSVGASKASATALDAGKASQIKENTETELKKMESEKELNKAKKVAQLDANF